MVDKGKLLLDFDIQKKIFFQQDNTLVLLSENFLNHSCVYLIYLDKFWSNTSYSFMEGREKSV